MGLPYNKSNMDMKVTQGAYPVKYLAFLSHECGVVRGVRLEAIYRYIMLMCFTLLQVNFFF